jgi:hypothetical protein
MNDPSEVPQSSRHFFARGETTGVNGGRCNCELDPIVEAWSRWLRTELHKRFGLIFGCRGHSPAMIYRLPERQRSATQSCARIAQAYQLIARA